MVHLNSLTGCSPSSHLRANVSPMMMSLEHVWDTARCSLLQWIMTTLSVGGDDRCKPSFDNKPYADTRSLGARGR